MTLSGGTIAGDVTLGTGSTLSATAKGSAVHGKLSVAQGGRLNTRDVPSASLTVSELVADGGELAFDPSELDALSADTLSP